MNVIIISPPIGPLGSGLCGGVDTTLSHLALRLKENGHKVLVVAAQGSCLQGISLKEISGYPQSMMQLSNPDDMIMLPNNSLLENMCEYVFSTQNEYDIILNFAYDWLPLYLTGYYRRPLVHWLTMCSCSTALDTVINKTIEKFPGHIAAFTQTQANTYKLALENSIRVLGGGIILNEDQFNPYADLFVAWVGRISPEKGLEDALKAISQANKPIKIMGCIQDPEYWEFICNQFPNARAGYLGYLSTRDLHAVLRKAQVLLVTSKCLEAFGNVAAEALACGVPVIAYRQGGLAEIIKHEKTGYLIDEGDITGMVKAIQQIDRIDRYLCRRQAESQFSFDLVYQNVVKWFQEIIAGWVRR